jgi:hypothetical protein
MAACTTSGDIIVQRSKIQIGAGWTTRRQGATTGEFAVILTIKNTGNVNISTRGSKIVQNPI